MSSITTPTLQDIAKQAGVSTATVSRCLNAPDLVQPTTRQYVLKIINQLDYTPNFRGVALASNRTNTMGVIIPSMRNAMFAYALQALEETLAKEGVTTLVASSHYDLAREQQQIKTLIGRGADGLLLVGINRPDSTYRLLKRWNVPYIVTWNYRHDEKHCYVGFDNKKGASAMTQYVLSAGHDNIAMIAGVCNANDRATDRVAGVRSALNDAGLDGDALPLKEARHSLALGGKTLLEIVRTHPQTTAVICGNDVLAVGALIAARKAGIRVPEDLSITGFDDIELALAVSPQLTTVRVPHKKMGEAAAKTLLSLKKGRKLHSIELETQIIRRDSLLVK